MSSSSLEETTNDSTEVEDDGQKTNINTEKAQDLMLKGRLLNSGHTFNEEAFDILSDAIKLDPYLMEAWIDLAKCYQRKPDIDGAIECLEKALQYCDSDKPNKMVLRKLSTCIRQKTCDSQEAKVAALLKSLDLSKQALKSDLYDEENYYNLAKAYMCLFFVTECVDQQLINLSRAAYTKALTLSNDNFLAKKKLQTDSQNDPAGVVSEQQQVDKTSGDEPPQITTVSDEDQSKPFSEQSDFLFNYSTVLVYLQEFQKALEYLRSAIRLEPEWVEPQVLEECLVDYLKQIHSMLIDLGKSNKKVVRRYSKVVESLRNVSKIETIIGLDQQRLQRSLAVRTKAVTLDELKQMNSNPKNNEQGTGFEEADSIVQILHLKLIATVNCNQAMYLTFIAIDQNYSLITVTIYNLAASRCPTPRDVVTIVKPRIDTIRVDDLIRTQRDSSITYERIDVRQFKDLYVNGQRITTDQVSKPQFRVSILP